MKQNIIIIGQDLFYQIDVDRSGHISKEVKYLWKLVFIYRWDLSHIQKWFIFRTVVVYWNWCNNDDFLSIMLWSLQPILKYTNKQRKLLIDQFFFVYMFVSLFYRLNAIKIKIESRLHCIDFYDDDGSNANKLMNVFSRLV